MTDTALSQPKIDYDSPDYKRSRMAYLIECAFEYFVSLLVTDAFLAKLLKDIGMSDATIGIVSSLISLAFLFQFFAVFVVQRISNTKRFAIIFHFASQMFFMSLYFIPFLPAVQGSGYKNVLVIACLLVAYFGNYLVTSVIYKWGNSFVEPHHRGRYSAGKEMVSLISGMVVTLLVGFIMDSFEAADNLHGGFIFAAIGIFVFSICDFTCLMLIKNDKKPKVEKKDIVPMREVLRNTFGNRSFRHVLLLAILWDIGRYATVGFLGTYRLDELALTVGAVQVINMCANFARFLVSRPFGAFSDKFSYARGIELALLLTTLSFAVATFTRPETWVLIIVHTALYQASHAGIVQNMNNVLFSYVDNRYFVQASAIKNSIGGLCGFGTSLLASRLLQYIQDNGNTFFGMQVYGQQVLACISFVVLGAAMLYTHFVIAKQKSLET